MVNTNIRLIIFFATEDGEALYSQQKQDRDLIVTQIMNSFFFFFFWMLLIIYFFSFILIYNTVLVLPYIDMNPPRVYMRSQT